MLRRALCAAALVAVGCAGGPPDPEGAASAQVETDDLFNRTAPVDGIRISANFAKLAAEAPEAIEPPSVDGTFVAPSLGVAAPLDVVVTVRGNTSTMKGECSFPKLKIKFKDKTKLDGTALKGHRTIRIATHCGELAPSKRTPIGRVANEIAPWREAFTYQVLRAVALEAPRARPAKIAYVDTGKKNALLERKAALIETTGDVAERLGGTEPFVVDSEAAASEPGADGDVADPANMSPNEMARVHFAEALVGNSDFRLSTETEFQLIRKDSPDPASPMWNMKSVRLPDGKERPVPVDFDLSALVAPQKGQAEHPKIWNGQIGSTRSQFTVLMGARTRFPRAIIDDARRDYAAREPAIMKLLQETPWLDPEARETATALMTSFFALMKNDKDFFVEVVAPESEYFRADGTPDEDCIATTVPAGTPVVRLGNVKKELGIEEVHLLDVRFQLACNQSSVWIKTGTPTTTNFPL
jgi:hypothetical protein